MIQINQEGWQERLKTARQNGDYTEANRIERLLDMVRQLQGARAQYSASNPPAFFVRGVSLGQSGEVERCEAFYLPEFQGANIPFIRGKLNLPSGNEKQALLHRCPHCGEPAPVVGEYYYDLPPNTGPTWILILYTLCGNCTRLNMIGEHEERNSFDERLK